MTAGIYALAGFSTVIENLANQLGKRGVEATIGALSFKHIPSNGAFDVSKIPVYNALKLKRFLDNFDIVHNHHPIMNYLALLNNKPFIYHFHGAPDFGRGSLYKLSMLSSIKMTRHRFDAVIAVSESAAVEFRRYSGLSNVHIIYNGVDTNRFKPALDERYRRGTPQFLFVGNLYQHKKVEELIFAMKRLVNRYPKSYLHIVGNGCMYNHLNHLVIELGLQSNVELIGYVPIDELPYYYASCDVYATASRWELFGLPLLEAMACGKPIVASSIPPHTELLTKSNAGVTYTIGNLDDLWQKMIRVYEEADRYKDNAVVFAKAHNWSIVTERLLNIYKKLVPSSSAPACNENRN
jgi:glycosyltransferase involved in cell wall biosynthesis